MSFMKFLLDNWILVVAALASGSLLAWPLIKRGAGSGGVSTTEAVRLINRERAVLVDVAEPAEFAAGHAAGARNIPLGGLEGAKGLPTNKALLRQRGVEAIEEIRVDLQPQERDRMIELTGRRTVPQIFIGATHVGGCDDLIELDRSGGLLPLLGG